MFIPDPSKLSAIRSSLHMCVFYLLWAWWKTTVLQMLSQSSLWEQYFGALDGTLREKLASTYVLWDLQPAICTSRFWKLILPCSWSKRQQRTWMHIKCSFKCGCLNKSGSESIDLPELVGLYFHQTGLEIDLVVLTSVLQDLWQSNPISYRSDGSAISLKWCDALLWSKCTS